ncbi:MAG: protein disulfide oxidoreductase [Gammaproteobacteria bacterium]|nr:protein disulfide oxidoreductase [Gammaproteobacteria bacterium]
MSATQIKTPHWRHGLIEALVLFAVLLGVHLYQTRDAIDGRAPPLAGVGLHGEALSLEALRGKAVLVQFWATWCPVCRVQEDSIQTLSEDWPVLSIALEDTPPETLRAYMNKAGLSFPVLRDIDGTLAARFGVRGTPTAFIVDPAGQIRFTEVGYTTGWGLRLRLWWAATIGSSPAAEPAR